MSPKRVRRNLSSVSHTHRKKARRCRLTFLLLLVSGLQLACGGETSQPSSPIVVLPTATRPPATVALPTPTCTSPPPTATHPPASPTLAAPLLPTATYPPEGCRLGTGMRQETTSILVTYKGHPGFVMTASSKLAQEYFPQLEGWIRVIGAPSLEILQRKAERANQSGTPYEALLYGLETSQTTPVEEWQDLVGSTQKARALADHYGKLLVMAPGFRLMSQNEDKYPPMVALAEVWVLQTQRLQVNPPGSAYRQEVEKVVNQIKSGNPDIIIWAQITLPPDRAPDAEEWLAYRQSIADLVDGTYIGVYTWKSADPDQLVATIEAIFAAVCGGEQ